MENEKQQEVQWKKPPAFGDAWPAAILEVKLKDGRIFSMISHKDAQRRFDVVAYREICSY